MPDEAPRVDLEPMVRGFGRARERYESAARQKDLVEAYIPLFEALSWAASIDERLGYPDQAELRGLRFVRHRVHHQFADALYLAQGSAFPMTFPVVFFEWRWRTSLPQGRPSKDEAFYRQHLAGVAARVTLGMVWGFLRSGRE